MIGSLACHGERYDDEKVKWTFKVEGRKDVQSPHPEMSLIYYSYRIYA
jgi:hypothetical protein